MKYCSTRGKVKGLSFKDALFSGYTSDGGLFVPESIPTVFLSTLQEWSRAGLSYPEVVFRIMRLFISNNDIPDSELRECVIRAYARGKFDIDEVVGIKECRVKNGEFYKVAELFHGPTASFKDYALSLVAQLMEYYLRKGNEHVVVLVGTSGDTGSAAIRAVEGLKGIDIIVLYPDQKISPVQEMQLNASTKANVKVIAVEGTSDDLDIPIRNCFPGEGICSINSINWVRILIQISHFVYLYLKEGQPLDIFIPTGAAGNLAAGLVASLMGVPIKLFPATNANDNVHAFLNKGHLRMGGKVLLTPANAMDIRFPYNLERIIYFLSNSAESTADFMKTCESSADNIAVIGPGLMQRIQEIIPESRSISNQEIREAVLNCWNTNGYMICPHTATAVAFLKSSKRRRNNTTPIVISTASPLKFPEHSLSVGIPIRKWEGDSLLYQLAAGPQIPPEKSMTKMNQAKWTQILKEKIAKIQSSKGKS